MIENELKYVIRKECESEVSKMELIKAEIHQGYLSKGDPTVRIRKCRTILQDGAHYTNYYITIKSWVDGKCVEIENQIDKADFDMLWSKSRTQIRKVRYLEESNYKEVWMIDFFKDDNNDTYFALAEVEMPVDKQAPDNLLDVVRNNLLYAVPADDVGMFSNQSISKNPEFFKDLYAQGGF